MTNLGSARAPLFILLLTFVQCTVAQTFTGKVIAVTDGDTVKVLVPGNQQVKVRLAQIDTPEKAAPWGNKAKQALAAKVHGQQVVIDQEKIDRYGRVVGTILLNGVDINRRMVAEGHAWAYRQYLRDQSLITLEKQAREQRIGLWSLPQSDWIAPWEWRRGKRAGPSSFTADHPPEARQSFTCGSKRYCSQMKSCEEARYFLNVCGRSSLDGDKDGVPCEALCR